MLCLSLLVYTPAAIGVELSGYRLLCQVCGLTGLCSLRGAGHSIRWPLLSGADWAKGSQSSQSVRWDGLYSGRGHRSSQWAQDGRLLHHNALMLLDRKITGGTALSSFKVISEINVVFAFITVAAAAAPVWLPPARCSDKSSLINCMFLVLGEWNKTNLLKWDTLFKQ